ncbi:MAG: glycosyltransferase family A protein [Candidatus Firestonebacteria bacterium]
MPLVSVIIPTYNRLDYIHEAIDSVLAQTYKNYEIIVVNDGSSVDIRKALEPYKDKIVYLSHQENRGLSAARNTGIKNSNGKYLAFLDDDDLFENQKLEIQVPVLENNPAIGFVYSDYYIFNSKSTDMKLRLAAGRDDTQKFAQIFFLNYNVAVPTILIRRTCFEDVGFFDEDLRQHEDGDMLLRVALQWRVGFSEYPSARVRYHDNQMSRNRIEIYNSIVKSWGKILSTNPEFKNSLGIIASDKLAELYFQLGRAYINNDMLKNSIAQFKLSRQLSKKYVNARKMFQLFREKYLV